MIWSLSITGGEIKTPRTNPVFINLLIFFFGFPTHILLILGHWDITASYQYARVKQIQLWSTELEQYCETF